MHLKPGEREVVSELAAEFPGCLSLGAQLRAVVTLAEAAGCSVEFVGTEEAAVVITRDGRDRPLLH